VGTFRHDSLDANSLPCNYIEWIFLDSKGLLWLTHWLKGGLTAFDPERQTFTHYRHDPKNPESPGSDRWSVVAEDRQGYIWIGGEAGLDRLDRRSGKFKHFRHDPADPGSLSYDFVRAIYPDRQGTLWIGTGFSFDGSDPTGRWGGLNRYHPETESFTRFMHEPGNPNSLANNHVRALLEDSRGQFWLGTDQDGLHQLDRATGKF